MTALLSAYHTRTVSAEKEVAVLVANYDNASSLALNLTAAELGLPSATASARDVWARADVGAADAMSFQLGARSSAFRILTATT